MRSANVRLLWVKSTSTDVTKQNLQVFVNGELAVSTDLAASVEEHVFGRVHDGDEVNVALVAVDGAGNVSVPATLDFVTVFPDVTAPESPVFVGQGWELVEFQDDEEPVV